MKSRNKSISIFDYSDYRKFLFDFLEDRKKQKLPASYRWFSYKAGFSSPNFLHLVIKEKRHLSENSLFAVCKVLDLHKDEEEFFRNLVMLNKSKSASEREFFARQITKQNKYKKAKPQLVDQFEYYSHWYNIVIRELIQSFPDKNWNPATLARAIQPTINQEQAAASLERLLRLGIISQHTNGYRVTNTHLSSGDQVSHSAIFSYHKRMIQLGMESLDRFAKQERNISSVSFGVSEEQFVELVYELETFRKKLLTLSEQNVKKDKVIQVNFQVFPIAKIKGEL